MARWADKLGVLTAVILAAAVFAALDGWLAAWELEGYREAARSAAWLVAVVGAIALGVAWPRLRARRPA
ncbi:hypothetical protein EAH89_05650 [Roseomonas nepalensis]|uniref:Uncharacterized protein n=1 Tax=Muricoccus nepalensis TaxID=1854500 RepID=A0A502GDX3_9PROT|nr:hypothetical protein [Roseomonas nepalensis]TPG59718.1 hypothetical protein EAH89_05650 [Roseomonas nepalensis]